MNAIGNGLSGTVVAAHGRHYRVDTDQGEQLDCFPRSKRSDIACGDRVEIERISADQGVIAEILPRRSLLYRSDAYRLKLIAANVSQVIIVVATEPPFSDEVLMRCLIAARVQNLATLVVLNKCDLSTGLPAALNRLAALEAHGQRVLRLSARTDALPLRAYLSNHLSLLVGQSGMGKSTLVNALVPGANSATREVSQALNSGKHTTTHATLYRLDPESGLIDSPGLQEFGLAHVSRDDIGRGFGEFDDLLGRCRFRDCRHEHEPDCALRAAVADGRVDRSRLALYLSIVNSLAK